MKEKKKNVTIENPKYEINARGSPVVVGTCASCGGKIYKIMSASDISESPDAFKKKVTSLKEKKKKPEK